MLDILRDYWELNEPPAMMDLYEAAFDLFERYDLQDYELAYSDALMTGDTDQLYALTISNLQVIAREHQLPIRSDAPMTAYIQALLFVKQIEHFEGVDQIADICEDEESDNNEKWLTLLELVISVPPEETMEYLPAEDVSVMLIKKIGEYARGRADLQSQIDTVDPRYQNMCAEMALFARIVGGTEMRSYQYLMQEGGAIGMPFVFYWKQNQEYLLGLEAQDMVYECIGFAFMSEEGTDNLQNLIGNAIASDITNLEVLLKIQNILTETIIQYKREISSGISLSQVSA